MSIDLRFVALQYFCLLFSLCVHEAAHAAMANWCGDPSARLMGRLTLDPRKHIDPLGTVIMPLLGMISGISFLFGWAKPVPFNPLNLRDMRRDPVFIALAGPISNLLIAIACGFLMSLLVLFMRQYDQPVLGILFLIAYTMMGINLILMLFNFLPVPPLDGHYLLHYFLPPSGQRALEQIGPFGIIIAMFVGLPWLRFSMGYVESGILWLTTFGRATNLSTLLS